jgi:hypothetical protein
MDRADTALGDFIERLAAAEAAEQARDRRVRERFEQETGHPRGPALVGANGAVWRRLEAADAAEHQAADLLAAEAIERFCAGDAATRARVVDALEGKRYLRWRLGWPTAQAINGIAEGGDAAERSVARGIAGIALGFADYRDAIVALDRLCLAALRAGVDPFGAIRSTTASLTVRAPTAAALRTLETYLDPDRQAALRRTASRPAQR